MLRKDAGRLFVSSENESYLVVRDPRCSITFNTTGKVPGPRPIFLNKYGIGEETL